MKTQWEQSLVINQTVITSYSIHYTKLYEIQQVLHKTWPDLLPLLEKQERPIAVANRPAQMCPGCGHRSAFHAIKNALTDEDITVADIGCHTLGFMEPYNMGQILMSMGASPAIASGLALGNKSRRVVAFIGDSTRITSYNVCYTKLLRCTLKNSSLIALHLRSTKRHLIRPLIREVAM